MGANDIIRFDWAAKRLLRQKANFGVLEGFVSVLLEEQITIVEILESESNQEHKDDKFNRVDIKAKNSKGELIIVEIQNNREIHYLERVLYGVSKAISEHIELGKTYAEIKKVYSISILYFDIWEGDDYIYHGQNKFKGLNTGNDLKMKVKEKNAIIPKLPEDVFPEYFLIRVNEFDAVAKTPLEEWIQFLKTGTISEDVQAAGLSEAREKLRYYSMTDKERKEYDEYINLIMIQNDVIGNSRLEGHAEGRAEGHAEGRVEGLREGRTEGMKTGRTEGRIETLKEMILNMYAINMSIEDICMATKLPIEQVTSFIEQNNSNGI